ncbi:hypothetical protein INT43_001772 [Umbelopsis isabellina]|uniref:Dipeptidyl-peptidase V n=1 Tax=Mortierella isabellina TaxID=91625 RepID=A0A8H7UDG9_MORIS|nr:hypothetical protein INT43_001772 [Umbelopsis isabellina]
MTLKSPKLLTPQSLVELPKTGMLITSPSGTKAIYSQSIYDSVANETTQSWYLLDLATNELHPLSQTFAQGDVCEMVFLDDVHLAVLQGRESSQFPHVFVFDMDHLTKEPYQLTDFPTEIGALRYNSASQLLGFAASVHEDGDLATVQSQDQTDSGTRGSATLYDRLPVRFWDSYLPASNVKKNNIFVVNLSIKDAKYIVEGKPHNLLVGSGLCCPHMVYGDADDYAFSPDGKYIAFQCKYDGRDSAWQTAQYIYVVSTQGGKEIKCLNNDIHAFSYGPQFASDGTLFYLQTMTPQYDADRLRIIAYDGQSRKIIADHWQHSPMSLAISQDSQTIYVTADEQAHLKIFAIDVKTEEITVLTHNHTATFVNVTKDGLLFRLGSMTHPHVIQSLNTTTLDVHTYSVTPALQEATIDLKLPEPEEFWFKGAMDDNVHGWIVKPAGFEPDKKYPVAFLVHGGPQMPFRDNWVPGWNPQIFTSAGYAVVGINRHGSTGFGREFCDCLGENWGSHPLVDLENGLDYALKQYSFLDAHKVIGLGFSFGGYLINWLNGHSSKYKALVNHGGMFSLMGTYYGIDELFFAEREFGGPPYQKSARETYEKYSPSNYVSNWKTPTLVIHGGKDYRIPETEGIATFTALQRQGVPSKFLYYPDEPHEITKSANLIRWYEEVLDWMNHWVKAD